jgi:hypothetical protein
MPQPPDYTVAQLLKVEQSYQYASPFRGQVAATGNVRTLPLALIAGLLAVSPVQLPALSTPSITRGELEILSQQTQEATTESAIFRRLVRQQGPCTAKPLPPLHPELEPAIELGDYDYYADLEMLPPSDPTTLVEILISQTIWAEPEWKDLDAEFSFLADDELA